MCEYIHFLPVPTVPKLAYSVIFMLMTYKAMKVLWQQLLFIIVFILVFQEIFITEWELHIEPASCASTKF